MKEKLCYVGYDIEQEQKLSVETTVLVESYTVSQIMKMTCLEYHLCHIVSYTLQIFPLISKRRNFFHIFLLNLERCKV